MPPFHRRHPRRTVPAQVQETDRQQQKETEHSRHQPGDVGRCAAGAPRNDEEQDRQQEIETERTHAQEAPAEEAEEGQGVQEEDRRCGQIAEEREEQGGEVGGTGRGEART